MERSTTASSSAPAVGIAPSLRRRVRLGLTHFGVSALVVALAALLVFRIWFPPPFERIAGGLSLFMLLICIDVTLGPALTAVVASPGKAARVFARDVAVIVVLQLAAFAYGVYSIALARPVALVFEVDLMRLVSAADIDPAALKSAPEGLQVLSWSGPRLMSAVKPTEGDEQLRAIELALAGIHLAMQPVYWREYASQADAAWRAARPVTKLLAQYPNQADAARRIAQAAGVATDSLRFLPLTSRHEDWVALLAPEGARVVGYLDVDGFF